MYRFQAEFQTAYNKIYDRSKLPILCGGTGLYLNSVLLISHNYFNDYSITNLFVELLIKDNYSITAGYSSIAQKLYYEDFSSNFFTGITLGFNILYQNYTLNFGIKNLGSTGFVNSITFSKSLN